MPDVSPCPKCGEREWIGISPAFEHRRYVQIVCLECGFRGEEAEVSGKFEEGDIPFDALVKAIADWNANHAKKGGK